MSGSGSSDSERIRRILEDLTLHERTRDSQVSTDSGASPREGGRAPEEFPRLPRYELKERVGEGATSVVYRAWDRDLQRVVAVKMLRESAGLSETARLRFRREAQAAAGLVHPNVVTVHDAGEEGGRLYIVMEFLEGRSLRELLDDGNATRDALIRLLEKVARGVAAAHERGVVHRDLKPANILVTAVGEPKVGDFGLAHLMNAESKMTRTGTALGTPLYMSPEQVEGRLEQQTARTDVYALGAILYEAVTGAPPHEGETVAHIYRRIVSEDPRLPRDVDPTIPRDLETVILKALEKEPARRYPTAAAFADDLLRLLGEEPIQARRAGAGTRALRRVRRNPVAAVIAGLAAAGMLGVWIYGSVRERRLEGERGLENARYVAERDATVSMMRETARLSLEAALALREKGDLAGMRRHLPALEEACRGARERAPQLAEIEYRMGRMHRALMDAEKALRYQEEALRKDPGYAPALYERAVLLSKQCGPGPLAARPGALVEESLRPETPGIRKTILGDLSLLLKSPEALSGGGVGLGPGSLLTARGMLAHYEGRQAEAREILELAVKQDPHLDEAWETLTRVAAEQDLAAAYGERERHWLEKEKALAQAVLKDRGFLPHLLGRGDLRRDRGNDRANRGESPLPDLQSAEEDYGEAIRLNGESQEAWLRRAQVRTQRASYLATRNRDPLQDFADAESDVDRLEKLSPASEMPPVWRSVVRVLRGGYLESRGRDPLPDYDGAVKDAEEGLRRKPESGDAVKRRGIARVQRAAHVLALGGDPTADFEKAEADLARSATLLSGGAEIWMWKGILAIRRGQFAVAETALSEALKLKPDYARAWMWRGVGRMGAGDFDAARQDLTAALKHNVGFPEAWLWRGVVGVRRADWTKAEEDLTQALTLDPGLADAWKERGNLRALRAERSGGGAEALKAYASAIEDWRAALRVNPALERSIGPGLEAARRKTGS